MIDIKKLKSLGFSILGVMAFYAIVSLLSWGIYEWLLEEDLGFDLGYPNFLGFFGILLMITIVNKTTFNDTEGTKISQGVPENGKRVG